MYNMLMCVKNCEILIFHSFFGNFQYIFNFSNFFYCDLWKNNSNKKRLKSVGNDLNLCGNTIFDLFGAPEQKKIGGPQGPPRPWQGFLDVALIRVKAAESAPIRQLLLKGAESVSKKQLHLKDAHSASIVQHCEKNSRLFVADRKLLGPF